MVKNLKIYIKYLFNHALQNYKNNKKFFYFSLAIFILFTILFLCICNFSSSDCQAQFLYKILNYEFSFFKVLFKFFALILLAVIFCFLSQMKHCRIVYFVFLILLSLSLTKTILNEICPSLLLAIISIVVIILPIYISLFIYYFYLYLFLTNLGIKFKCTCLDISLKSAFKRIIISIVIYLVVLAIYLSIFTLIQIIL